MQLPRLFHLESRKRGHFWEDFHNELFIVGRKRGSDRSYIHEGLMFSFFLHDFREGFISARSFNLFLSFYNSLFDHDDEDAVYLLRDIYLLRGYRYS